MDPRGFPTTLAEFQRVFPDEVACAKYLEHLRWPHGFTCTKCGNSGEPYRFAKRTSVVLRCKVCQTNVSLMADTVMKGRHTPLSIGFWGAYLVATQTPGQSALQFQRPLGLSRYETAFQRLHKLRAARVRPERDAIGSQFPVEVDETRVGGRTKGEGRGVHTIRRRSLEPLRYAPVSLSRKARSTRELSMLEDCGCASCQAVEPRNSRNSCKRMSPKEPWCAPMDGRATMIGQNWATRTNPWCLMVTPKEPMPTCR